MVVSSYLGASDLTRACMKEREVSLATNLSLEPSSSLAVFLPKE